MVARWEGGWGDWVKKVKGLRSTNWQLQNSLGDVKDSIRDVVNTILITAWCQMGARFIETIT